MIKYECQKEERNRAETHDFSMSSQWTTIQSCHMYPVINNYSRNRVHYYARESGNLTGQTKSL